MRRFWPCLIVLILMAVPALSLAQNLPGNLSCRDLLEFADGKAPRRTTPAIAPVEKPDAPVRLIVGESGAPVWSRQDDESPSIAKLEKGEELTALGYGLGTASWYMVRTKNGIVGWVRSSDVQGGDSLKKSPEAALMLADTPEAVDVFTQALLAYDIALCRRLVRGQISVDDFNVLHNAMVLGLNAERERMDNERQRLDLQARQLRAQREAVQAQREATQAQRQTTEALMQQQREWQNYWRNWAENQERRNRDPIRCDGIVSGGAMRVRCK